MHQGAPAHSIIQYTTRHSIHNPPPARPPRPQFIKGDLQSADLLSYVLTTEQIDTVMHFAAQTHVDNSFGNSLAFTMNNTWVLCLEVVGMCVYAWAVWPSS